MKTKLLLYCTKAKKQKDLLWSNNLKRFFLDGAYNRVIDDLPTYLLNGKIVAECDFEVEEISSEKLDNGVGYEPIFYTESIDDILKKSCLTQFEIENYLGSKAGGEVVGYAIHIKNLHIFDEPRDIRNYYTNRVYTKIEDVYTDEIQIKSNEWCRPIKNAPQNMCYAFDNEGNKYIVISIQSQWMCLILNRIKDVEVRRVVLKEMLKDDKTY